MNVKHTVQCCNRECKAKRAYEAKTFGDCLRLAKSDGWKFTGRQTAMLCKECAKNMQHIELK